MSQNTNKFQWTDLLGALPVVGSALSSIIGRGQALRDIREQRAYESPENQLKLLKDAGIPAAAYFSGSAGQQSELPRATNIDPSLGTAEGVEKFMQNRMSKMQLALTESELRKP